MTQAEHGVAVMMALVVFCVLIVAGGAAFSACHSCPEAENTEAKLQVQPARIQCFSGGRMFITAEATYARFTESGVWYQDTFDSLWHKVSGDCVVVYGTPAVKDLHE